MIDKCPNIVFRIISVEKDRFDRGAIRRIPRIPQSVPEYLSGRVTLDGPKHDHSLSEIRMPPPMYLLTTLLSNTVLWKRGREGDISICSIEMPRPQAYRDLTIIHGKYNRSCDGMHICTSPTVNDCRNTNASLYTTRGIESCIPPQHGELWVHLPDRSRIGNVTIVLTPFRIIFRDTITIVLYRFRCPKPLPQLQTISILLVYPSSIRPSNPIHVVPNIWLESLITQ
jgi:hypothetical protein